MPAVRHRPGVLLFQSALLAANRQSQVPKDQHHNARHAGVHTWVHCRCRSRGWEQEGAEGDSQRHPLVPPSPHATVDDRHAARPAPAPPTQVVRLPALRNRIAAWRSTHGLPPLPPLDPPPEVLRAAGEECAALLSRLRCGDVFERGLAAGRVNDLLIEWGCSDDALAERRLVMEVRGEGM